MEISTWLGWSVLGRKATWETELSEFQSTNLLCLRSYTGIAPEAAHWLVEKVDYTQRTAYPSSVTFISQVYGVLCEQSMGLRGV